MLFRNYLTFKRQIKNDLFETKFKALLCPIAENNFVISVKSISTDTTTSLVTWTPNPT